MLSISPGVFNLSFLFRRNNPWVRFHISSLTVALTKNVKSFFLVLARALSWFLYFGWRRFFRVAKLDKALFIDGHKSNLKVNFDLFYLTFGLMVPPYFYYNLKLFSKERKEWINFIYEHESPHWQEVLSGTISKEAKQLINSKNHFFVKGKEEGLPIIETKKYVKVENGQNLKAIFEEEECYLKLNVSHSGLGTFKIKRELKNGEFLLFHELDGNQVHGKENILNYLLSNFQGKYFMIQPVLRNADSLKELLDVERLAVIKLITVSRKTHIDVIHAQIHIPIDENQVYNRTLTIGAQSGCVDGFYTPGIMSDNDSAFFNKLKDKEIPKWSEIIALSRKSHQLVSAVRIISSDIAITKKGLRIIEMNLNPNILVSQFKNQKYFNELVFMSSLEKAT